MTSIYSTGTVSVTNGNAVVTGSGTAWDVAGVGGGMFSSAGVAVPILSVEGNTSLTLAYPWPGADAAGSLYAIQRDHSDAASVVDLYDRFSRVLVTLSLIGIHPNDSGTIAKRDALTLTVDDEGFFFAHVEIGYDITIYRWTGTAWEGPFDTKGADGLPGVGAGGYGLPAGGTTGQFLRKASGTDGDTGWATVVSREKLTTDRIYYVRLDGSDSNDGKTNTAGGAFLTRQKAIDVVTDTLDMAGFNVTIQCANGIYTDTFIMSRQAVGGIPSIQGDVVTPSNVLISTNGVDCFLVQNRAQLTVKGFKGTTVTDGYVLRAFHGGRIYFESMDFGSVAAGAGSHIGGDYFGECIATGDYTISGGAVYHVHCNYFGGYDAVARTITLTGTPAFSAGFVGNREASVVFQNCTFSGSATGKRFVVHRNGMIDTLNAGLTALPGDVAGDILSGAVYDTYQSELFVGPGSFTASTAHIYTAAIQGLVITGGVGSSTDVAFFSAAGFELMGNPTGTANLQFSSGGVGSLGFCTTPLSTSWSAFKAGTAAKSVQNWASGALKTSVAAGDWDYDGKALYFAVAASSRGVVAAKQIATVQGSTVALSNSSTSAQNIFAAANDTLAVAAATTYRFRAQLKFNTGATSHFTSFGLGGTATFTSISYVSTSIAAAANTFATPAQRRVETAAASAVTGATTAVTTDVVIEGIMRINAAGTIIPQITFSAGPTGTCETALDSYFELEPIGLNTVAAVGNWA
jgi:hypothetical protein